MVGEGLSLRAGQCARPEPCGLTAPQQKTLPGGRYKVMRGGAWPSALNLPQLPFRALTSVPARPMPSAWTKYKRVLEPNKLTLPVADQPRKHPRSVLLELA